ncbi:unnamed protein product [Gongylonema pulchrum]|uniref:AMP-binding_C domain-containing protein n=1 Tax=Gongylonema pulchrum TaxID=637853 RepID=A0A183ED67_9BILA|nr:unnamed protein product [Gongylonema pulchrum]
MISGVPHHDLGEAVLALCVREPGHHCGLHENEAVSILRTQLANYKIPKHILFVDELPRNALGKVQKNILRENYQKIFGRGHG